MNHTPDQSPLGKASAYQTEYAPELLFPIARQQKRDELGLSGTLPFFGVDIWNAYELSWLNMRGKPQVAIATFTVPADSPNLVESKSFKLYLNSFNQTRLANTDALLALLREDLSNAFGASVHVSLSLPDTFGSVRMGELDGLLLDRLDVEIDAYRPAPDLLKADHENAIVEETLVSHLLKSNCLVTGQPDWASVQIRYTGPKSMRKACSNTSSVFASTMSSTNNVWSASSWTSCASANRTSLPCMPAIPVVAASTSIPGAPISVRADLPTCAARGSERTQWINALSPPPWCLHSATLLDWHQMARHREKSCPNERAILIFLREI